MSRHGSSGFSGVAALFDPLLDAIDAWIAHRRAARAACMAHYIDNRSRFPRYGMQPVRLHEREARAQAVRGILTITIH